jgi:site-specific DNA recombinase
MTVGIYIRVSKQEQALEGYSIDAQKERLTAYCKAQGWTDYRFYIEEGISGRDTNRPKLQLLLEHIKGGQIKTLLVYRLDRLTRSVIDLHKLLKFLQDHGCAFKSATEMYDTTTANGRMFMGIVALLAQWESENLSERVKMALEQKVSEGERVGNIPYGFDLTEDEKLVKNEKSSVVLDMVEKVKSGWSLNRIANYLNLVNNDREWRANTVLRILRNPALYGATRWNDKVFENTHEGIMSKEEFLKLQQILDDRAVHHRRDVKSTYLFQGVLICPSCGRPLSVNRYIRKRKDGSEYQSAIYRCQVCWKEGKKVFTIGEQRFLDALKEYMKNVEIKPIEQPEEEKDEKTFYLEQLKQIERKREKYQRAWAADLISDEEFEQRMSETREAYEEIKKKLDEFKDEVKVDPEQLKNIVLTFNTTFEHLTQEEKREFISRFIRKIHFKAIPKPPTRPDKYKTGKPLIVITDVEFY